MALAHLLQQNANTPELIWTALGAIAQSVEALVVLVSAIAVFRQLKQMQEQSIANKIAGLNAALETLDTMVFKQVSKQALTGSNIHGINWNDLLDQINRVAILIDQEFTDEELLLNQRGKELAAIDKYIQAHSHIQGDLVSQFLPAWELLERARNWSPQKRKLR